jgi:hypothetical protein
MVFGPRGKGGFESRGGSRVSICHCISGLVDMGCWLQIEWFG